MRIKKIAKNVIIDFLIKYNFIINDKYAINVYKKKKYLKFIKLRY